jgi:5'-nucleotidase
MDFSRIACAVAAILTTIGCANAAPRPPAAGEPKKAFTVKIIGFNDYHGNLQSPGTFGENTLVPIDQRPPVGGADYIAGHVDRMKAENPLNVVVGAGDFVGATPLISALFYDEPSIETVNRIGLEFNAVGNHEFDDGKRELKRLQRGGCRLTADGAVDPNSCKGAQVGTPVPFEGAQFRYLSANVYEARTGKPLLAAYGLKKFKGVPVAFIGLTLEATPTIVTPVGVRGLQFRDEAVTVNELVPRLKALGVEAIVVLIHEGGTQTGTLQDINGCEGGLAGSAIADIVGRFDDEVDLVVSGHTHAAYNCRVPNSAGRAISVTSASAFGRVLTDIDVTIDPATRDIVSVGAANRLVDRTDAGVTPDAQVKSIVDSYSALVTPIANQVIGSITESLSSSAVDIACNVPAGDLIADAQLAATTAPDLGGAAFALMNRGGVRSPGFVFAQSVGEGDGNVTYGEGFTVQPFGNSLVTMTLTAQDIKNVLEQQFAGCRGQSTTATRLMIPSAGFKYAWDGAQACDARIRDVTLTRSGVTDVIVDGAGHVPNPTKTYRLTVNNFMSTGGDGFTTFLAGTDRLGGAQDIDALVSYMAAFKAPNAAYNPNDPGLAKPRISRIGSGTVCPTGSVTNP